MASLLDADAVRARLRRRFDKQRAAWLNGEGAWPLNIPLGVPTERAAQASLSAVRAWVEVWAAWVGPGEIIWVERRWPSLGAQRLPERLRLTNAQQVADWLDEGIGWRRARDRQNVLNAAFPGLKTALGAHYDWLAEAEDKDFERLYAVLAWLIAHPDSGLYPRQLPISGLDSKWVEGQRARLTRLLRVLRDDLPDSTDFHTLTGLRREPVLLRLRLLDPLLRTQLGDLEDISAPVEQIAALPIRPRTVFLVENLRTGLAFTDLPGAAVIMAQGYAVDVYGQLPWLRHARCIYWGDIDTHGFAILNRLRHHLPKVTSALMDEATLLTHRDLWSRENKPATGEVLGALSTDEQALYAKLRDNTWQVGVRLEQERIDWGYASARVQALLIAADEVEVVAPW